MGYQNSKSKKEITMINNLNYLEYLDNDVKENKPLTFTLKMKMIYHQTITMTLKYRKKYKTIMYNKTLLIRNISIKKVKEVRTPVNIALNTTQIL